MTTTNKQVPDRAAIRDDDPLRLDIAARLAFPDGSMTVAVLRRERDAGRLAVERIGNRDYTTIAAIKEMREQCRLAPNPRDSGSDQRDMIRRAGSPTPPPMSSSIQAAKYQLEQISKNKPNGPLPSTSSKSTYGKSRHHR